MLKMHTHTHTHHSKMGIATSKSEQSRWKRNSEYRRKYNLMGPRVIPDGHVPLSRKSPRCQHFSKNRAATNENFFPFLLKVKMSLLLF